MNITMDQYLGLTHLEQWYRKYNHQFIEISGVIGTGVWQIVQRFIDDFGFDPREIMYLSYDQKQVLELAAKRYHAYYLNGIIYKYHRVVNLDSLPVINPNSNEIEYTWKKEVRKKIDEKYKLIIVFDSVLMNHETLRDLGSFGLPVILIRDPALIPSPDSFTYIREPNIILNELNADLIRNPIVYFANKVLRGDRIDLGNYDTVSVVPRKQLNLYNLKSSEMVITLSDELSKTMNTIYREKVMHLKDTKNIAGERVIVMNNMYAHKLVNEDEKKIKVYLTKGTVGTISKCNKHAEITRFVPIDFKTEFYHEPFTELMMDRHYLNGVMTPSRQQKPDEYIELQYAYALSTSLSRLSHWDKVTVIADNNEEYDEETQRRLLYNAISRAKRSMTLVI